MTDQTLTFEVNSQLAVEFSEVAAAQDFSSAQVLRAFMQAVVEDHRRAVSHGRWKKREIDNGTTQADCVDADKLSAVVIRDDWEQQKNEIRLYGGP